MDDDWADSRAPIAMHGPDTKMPALSASGAEIATSQAAVATTDTSNDKPVNKAHVDEASRSALAIINLSRAKKQRMHIAKMLGAVQGQDGKQQPIRVTKQPTMLTGGTLQAHQLQGLQWLIEGRMTGTGLILADGKQLNFRADQKRRLNSSSFCRHGSWKDYSGGSILRPAS